MQRRTLLRAAAAGAVLAGLPFRAGAGDASGALADSQLVYLSPIKSDGSLSSCQAEVWFVMVDADLYVCSASTSWRARAPGRGAANTRLWVGDLGVWTRADYQSLPSVDAVAAIETDPAKIEAALGQFGRKYPSGWGTWGPRFRKGLADGTRSMLRYRLRGQAL